MSRTSATGSAARRAFARALAALGLALGIAATPSSGRAAEGRPEWKGHLVVGYGKLFASDAPGGSFSIGAGLDYPLPAGLRAGVDVGYHLLGSRSVLRGSQTATVDYSVFEAAGLLHWEPRTMGPLGRVSLGPAVLSTRAELSTSGGGAAFSDLAVEDVVPGAVLEAALLSKVAAPVRIGLEIGARQGFRGDEDWTVATARVAIFY